MNSLSDLGRWGSNLLGEASNQLAPAASTATSFASSTFQGGSDLLRKGASKAKNSLKSTGSIVAAKHTFDDPRGGTHVVSEVCHMAEGAFGAVVKVRDSDGTEYALKKIGCQEGVQIASSLKDAENEAKILKTLPPHANIIRCYGSSTVDHGPGSATVKVLMELCPGGTLLDYMDSLEGKLGAKEVVQPFAQICDAVGHLHAQKPPIQHRDLKVENVLMGADGRWKLCDFGSCSTEVVPAKELSRSRFLALQEEIDKTVTMLYRPPEMADIELNYRNGYEINTQVDIWMLGCILYTLTFYRHPFQDNPTAMAIANGKYFIPDDHPLGKSQKLCGLIHWLLAKDPKDRPNTSRIGELLREIGKIQYSDLHAQMPNSVKEKIKRLDALFAKRKDTGDIPLPPAAAALMAARGEASATSAGSKSPAKAAPRRDAGSAKASQQTAPSAPREAGNDAFDMMSFVGSSGSTSNNHVGVAQNQKTAAAPAPVEDLLSLGSPQFQAAAPKAPTVAAGAPQFNDLLSFGDPTPAVSSAPAPAAAANWANFAAAPPVAPAPPASADWCDFANFASAPAPPVAGGYNASPAPVATPTVSSNDLLGFDCLAPSPAPAISCGGQSRSAATPANGSFNLLDF